MDAKQPEQPQPAPAKAPKKPELEDTYAVDEAGNISIIKTVKGERPKAGTPVGHAGTVVASAEQIAAYKAAQK